jgi:hypothetical protein
MERILNSDFCRSLSHGRSVELWEDNQINDGWCSYLLVAMRQDEATVLAEFRIRGEQIERRAADPTSAPAWIPLE